MKNIQVIDSAENCVYDIFAATDDEFSTLFPPGQDVAFINEIVARENHRHLAEILGMIWTRRVRKRDVMGIHGMLFYELEYKAIFYPTRRDEEAVNPDGTWLRAK